MRRHDATLVVLEFGGTWPAWLSPAGSGRVAVIAQPSEGPPTALFAQVASRLSKLEAEGYVPGSVVLVWSMHAESRWTAARDALARGLLARLARSGGGELVIALPPELGQRARHRVRTLLTVLSAESCGVRVSARVGAADELFPSRISGLAPAAALAAAS